MGEIYRSWISWLYSWCSHQLKICVICGSFKLYIILILYIYHKNSKIKIIKESGNVLSIQSQILPEKLVAQLVCAFFGGDEITVEQCGFNLTVAKEVG